MRLARIQGHSFVVDWLNADSVVVDLGANRGQFATAVIAHFGCTVIALEPVADLFATLPDHPRLLAERAAIASAVGEVAVIVNRADDTSTIRPEFASEVLRKERAPATTLDDLFARRGVDRVQLLKLDVEGAELDVLATVPAATLARVEQLTVEYHDFLRPELAEAVAEVDARIRGLGFVGLRLSRDNSDVLYVNGQLRSLSQLAQVRLIVRYRYAAGARRRLARWLRRSR